MSVAVDIAVEADAWSDVPDLEGWIRRSVAAAADATSLSADDQAEVSVLLCDDEAIRVLNRDWRDKDKPTNVLSFPVPEIGAGGGPRLLGDIAVAYETAAREAAAEGRPLEAHLAHLVVHGFLHLMAHDHEDAAEAQAMEALETAVLGRLGLPDPYAGSEPELPGG
jgi:probable rRNA maturation factor